jgi:hypothetical protein
MLIPILLSALIAIAHYFSDKIGLIRSEFREHLISFVAGVSMVYVFVNLYPEFYKAASVGNPLILTAVLVGFVTVHLIDKEIYQKIHPARVTNDIRIAHGYGLIVYYFVIGIVLVELLNVNTMSGLLFFIPVFIYSGLSTVAAHGIHGMHGPHQKTISHLHFLQGAGVLGGTVFALFIQLPESLLIYLIGLVAGILTFIIVRDMLPKGKRGRPVYFLLGAVAYFALILMLWSI